MGIRCSNKRLLILNYNTKMFRRKVEIFNKE